MNYSGYSDRKSAHAALVKLERQYWSGFNLKDMHVYYYETDIVKKLNNFLIEKLGKKLDESDDWIDFPTELTDDDFFEFLNIAKLRKYKVIESNGGPEFWAVWLPDEKAYLTAGETEYLVFSESMEKLKTDLEEGSRSLIGRVLRHRSLEGELEEISATPKLLGDLIESHEGARFEDKRILLDYNNIDIHIAINELLKVPMFELRKLSLEQIKAL